MDQSKRPQGVEEFRYTIVPNHPGTVGGEPTRNAPHQTGVKDNVHRAGEKIYEAEHKFGDKVREVGYKMQNEGERAFNKAERGVSRFADKAEDTAARIKDKAVDDAHRGGTTLREGFNRAGEKLSEFEGKVSSKFSEFAHDLMGFGSKLNPKPKPVDFGSEFERTNTDMFDRIGYRVMPGKDIAAYRDVEE